MISLGAHATGSRHDALRRARALLAAAVAAALGAAPHVLHHAGPLAGAAILAGASGKVLFGVLGFVLALPMLRRLRATHGSWLLPGGVLALMAAAFAISTFVIGPAITAEKPSAPAITAPTAPTDHDAHHR